MSALSSAPSISKWAFTILLASATSTSCGMGSAAGGPGENDTTAPRADSAPTPDELANATYAGVFDELVTLVDGRWEGAPYVDGGASRPGAGLVEDFVLAGDLNGDGRDEAVVLLWESSGGSGTRSYLAVMARDDGAVVNQATVLIGDRVQIKTGFITDGLITLELIQAGLGDAACCPTQKALSGWQLKDGTLVRIAHEITGVLSLDDLRGPEWVLAAIGWNDPVSADPQIRIHFDGDRVDGTGGCNSYFGTVTSETPGQLAFSAMGTTMMACPEPAMELERRYLRTLAGGSSYSFVAGRLVIGCETDDGPVSLIFEQELPTESAADAGP